MRHYDLHAEGWLANGTFHRVELVVPFDEPTMSFVGNITELFPATVYNVTITGCTTPGCGPNISLSQRTNEQGKFTMNVFHVS